MSRWGLFAAGVGLAILALVLYQTDLREVGSHLSRLTALEVAALVGIYFSGRLGGVLSWLLTMTVDVSPFWFARLLRVHMIGCAVERLTPLAGLGGEPVKLAILKREYGVGLRDATASLALTRMTDLAAILLFCALGLLVASTSGTGSDALRRPALLALAFLVASSITAFTLQRARVLARFAPRLRRRWPARFSMAGRVGGLMDAVVDVETRMVDAYKRRPGRLSLSVAATFAEWLLEGLLIWSCLGFLDVPVAAATAISIAAFALAVRTAFFFVPADIGTQEAALVAICEALIGVPSLGLAIAAVIRLGELLWTVVGVAIGVRYVVGNDPREPGAGNRER